MDLQRQVEAADQVVTKAKAALAAAEVEEAAAVERLAQERVAAGAAAERKAAADPFQEKQYLTAMREAELGAARVAACERLASEARAKVETAREALRTAELEAARRQLQAVEAELAARGKALEALVRKVKSQVAEELTAYAGVLAQADNLLWAAPERGERTSVASDWRRACQRLADGDGILVAVERVVDEKDLAATAAGRSPSAAELNQEAMVAAQHRHVLELVREREEQEKVEAFYRERNKSRAEAISLEVLEHFKQQAIESQQQREGIMRPAFDGDFHPAVG